MALLGRSYVNHTPSNIFEVLAYVRTLADVSVNADLCSCTGQANNVSSLNRITIVPNGDITITGWTDQAGGTTNIFASIDENTTDDSDYIKAVAII